MVCSISIKSLLFPNRFPVPMHHSHLIQLEFDITYSIHYTNACAIHRFVYKSFLSLLSSPPRPFPFFKKAFAGSPLGSGAKFSTFSATQFACHESRIAHCRLEIYWLLLVFPTHKHLISLQLPPFSLIRVFENKTPAETFLKFSSITHVIDRSDQNPPITARQHDVKKV